MKGRPRRRPLSWKGADEKGARRARRPTAACRQAPGHGSAGSATAGSCMPGINVCAGPDPVHVRGVPSTFDKGTGIYQRRQRDPATGSCRQA